MLYRPGETHKEMLIGAGISGNQAEGPNGRRPHRWDRAHELHRYGVSHTSLRFGNGVAFDEKYPNDIDMLRDLGLNTLRMSLSAQRTLDANGRLNMAGIDHYRRVIDYARKRDIEVILTVHHFDDIHTGVYWADPRMVEIFVEYSFQILMQLGDMVNYWTPINEPKVNAFLPYQEGILSLWPDVLAPVRAIENQADAHKRFYDLAKAMYPDIQIVTVDNIALINPANNLWISKQWADILGYLDLNFFLEKVKDHTDIIGLNYYFHRHYGMGRSHIDQSCVKYSDIGTPLYPEKAYDVLMNLWKFKRPIIITEFGLADGEGKHRAWYTEEIVKAVKRATEEGVPILGLIMWALIDNFEMPPHGWDALFGLISVDRGTQVRTIKPGTIESVAAMRSLCERTES